MLPDTGIDNVKKQRNAEYAKHINDREISSLKMEGIRLLFFPKIIPFMRYCRKILQSRESHRRKWGACALHAGYLRLKARIQNAKYLLFFLCNSGYTKAPQSYLHTYSTLPVLFIL
jgi:hypothetical protein